jgi:hypothetical protein
VTHNSPLGAVAVSRVVTESDACPFEGVQDNRFANHDYGFVIDLPDLSDWAVQDTPAVIGNQAVVPMLIVYKGSNVQRPFGVSVAVQQLSPQMQDITVYMEAHETLLKENSAKVIDCCVDKSTNAGLFVLSLKMDEMEAHSVQRYIVFDGRGFIVQVVFLPDDGTPESIRLALLKMVNSFKVFKIKRNPEEPIGPSDHDAN